MDINGATNPPTVGNQSVTCPPHRTLPSTGPTQTPTPRIWHRAGRQNNPISARWSVLPHVGGACQIGTSGRTGHSLSLACIPAPTRHRISPGGAGGEQSPPVQINVTYPNAVTGIQMQLPANASCTVDVDQRRCDPTDVPAVKQRQPDYLHCHWLQGGFGFLTVDGTNTSTSREAAVGSSPESPAGSGTYVGQMHLWHRFMAQVGGGRRSSVLSKLDLPDGGSTQVVITS